MILQSSEVHHAVEDSHSPGPLISHESGLNSECCSVEAKSRNRSESTLILWIQETYKPCQKLLACPPVVSVDLNRQEGQKARGLVFPILHFTACRPVSHLLTCFPGLRTLFLLLSTDLSSLLFHCLLLQLLAKHTWRHSHGILCITLHFNPLLPDLASLDLVST